MHGLHDLQHPQVRDLGYSCFSEPLISAFDRLSGGKAPAPCSLHLTEKRIAWLRQLDRNPAALTSYLDQIQPRRLGLYHEALWHFFLQQDEEVDLVAKNCQVKQAGRTMGEYDVIYRDLNTGHHIHLELAFKVYLQAPNQAGSDLANWLGPNVNDRFDRKLAHMLDHQSQLSMTEAGKKVLQSMAIEHVETEVSLRGCLLYGERSDQNGCAGDLINPDHQRGHWLPVSKVIPLLDQSDRWIALSRMQWISPINYQCDDSYEPATFAVYLRQHFERSNSSIMICALGGNDTGCAIERFRLMVTQDHWPACQSG